MTTDIINIRIGKNVAPHVWADGYQTLPDLGVKMYSYDVVWNFKRTIL